MTFKQILIFLSLFLYLNSYAQDIAVSISTEKNQTQIIDVQSYDLNLQVIPESKLLRGTAKLNIFAKERLESISLDFHNSFKISSVKINDTIVSFQLIGDHEFKIIPNRRIHSSEFFDVEVKYYNTSAINKLWDETVVNGSFYFSGIENYLLYPCNYTEGDRARYKVALILPDNTQVVAFSLPSEGVSLPRTVVESNASLSPSNFTINILKNYSKFDVSFKRGFGVLTSDVKIQQFTPIDSTVIFHDLLKFVPEQISFLDSLIGNYPFNSFSVLITKDTEERRVYHSRECLAIPYEFTLDNTEASSRMINGLMHQWFGDKISVKEENDRWITEGLSVYFEWLWIERHHGKKEFDKMLSSKLVEARKYMGLINWKNLNPYPMYLFDLHYAFYDFGELSKHEIIPSKEMSFLYKVISLDTANVSPVVKKSFRQRFGHEIYEMCKEGHSYYDFMQWAKLQDPGTFYISSDGFHTLKSIPDESFKTYKFKLAESGDYIDHFSVGVRGALFIQYLRYFYGDEVFFRNMRAFINRYSGRAISTNDLVKYFEAELGEEINKVIDKWLFSDDSLPSFPTHHK
ncbi:MAG: hypothetical protein KAH10_01060 [Flavobacteriales bacterium]|nr:hypothetical protein [Flavobacteriales bacterium]